MLAQKAGSEPGQSSANGIEIWKAARRSLVKKSLLNRATLRHLVQDLGRAWDRVVRPPGIALFWLTGQPPGKKIDELIERAKFLFPESYVAEDARFAKNPPPSRFHGFAYLKTLWKGGLFVEPIPIPDEGHLSDALRRASVSGVVYHQNNFILVETSRLETFLVHSGSGFMAKPDEQHPARISNDALLHFACACTSGGIEPLTEKSKIGRGAFVVLLGLDGSGKTTVARQLCCSSAVRERFSEIRYFHWLPRAVPEFPLPEYRNLARKPQLRRTPLQTVLSALRLLKNLFRANYSYLAYLRGSVKHGRLVIVDRYFYNYFLDPASVKYYGPAWLLEKLRPLFPKPDFIVVFKAPPETLLARKQELSKEEILRQSALLEKLEFHAKRVMHVNAAQPPEAIAASILREIAGSDIS